MIIELKSKVKDSFFKCSLVVDGYGNKFIQLEKCILPLEDYDSVDIRINKIKGGIQTLALMSTNRDFYLAFDNISSLEVI